MRTALKLALSLVASLCLLSNVLAQNTKERVESYIEKYKSLAISEMQRTGVPASITLAQGILETGFGQSELAVHGNNHFGIKCKTEWMGEKMYHDDDAKGECFRKYTNVEESYRDHSDFLKNRPHYKFLFDFSPTDYHAWAHGLKRAGYATNPAYAQRLIKYIEDYNLQQYTLIALEQTKEGDAFAKETKETDTKEVASRNEEPSPVTASIVTAKIEEPVIINSPVIEAANISSVAKYPVGKTFSINETKVLYVEAGTSLLAIATNHAVTYNRLLEFNELNKVDILERNQLIYLERKQKRGDKDIHIVEANETLYDIAQTEGIQLNSLIELNQLTKDTKLTEGQRLYLKASSPVGQKIVSASKATKKIAG